MPRFIQTPPVGHRRIKNHLSQVLRETVHQGMIAPVSNNGEIDAYLVPVEAMEQVALAERLQETIPLLMAAVAAGAALPSQTLRDLGVEIPLDWRQLNRFTTQTAVTFTSGEDGEPWVAMPSATPERVVESDVEIDL